MNFSSEILVKKRDIIEFEVDKMEFGGTTVSSYKNKDIHMKGGITGQKVRAVVKRTKSGKADVKMIELLENSPIETAETCKHFNQCGGCSILSIPYEKQLEIKERQVMDLFLNQDSVSYTHLTLPTIPFECRSRWSPYH